LAVVGIVRSSDTSAEVSPGAFQHFKGVIDRVEASPDLLEDFTMSRLVKLIDYAEVGKDASELRNLYAKWLGSVDGEAEG